MLRLSKQVALSFTTRLASKKSKIPLSTVESGTENKPVYNVFTTIGMLGYEFDEHEMHVTLERLKNNPLPPALIMDSGLTDSGPQKLANNSTTCPRSSYKRD